MSILIRLAAGRYRPLVTCDACGKPITDPTKAVVVFDMLGEGDLTPRFAHKGRCHEATDREIKSAGGFPGWNELGRWFADLLHNSGLSGSELENAFRRSDVMARLGL